MLAKLLYGTGMRLMESLRLRVKDVDFDRQMLVVREANGGKDREVMLPRSLHEALNAQVSRAPRRCGHMTAKWDVSTTMIYKHVLKVTAGARPAR